MIDLEDILNKIKEYCIKNNNRYGTLKEMNISYDRPSLNYRSKKDYGVDTFDKLLRNIGYGAKGDLIVNNIFIQPEKLTVEDIKILIKEFINKFGKTPTNKDYSIINNLPSYSKFVKIIKNNNLNIKDFYKENRLQVDNKDKQNDKYNNYVLKLKQYILDTNTIPKFSELTKLGFPDGRWFVVHSNNKNVNNYNSFLEYELKVKPRFYMSKEMAINIILRVYKDLGHSPTRKELNPYVHMSIIKRIWGSTTNMKKELGLELTGSNNMNKHIAFEDLKIILLKTCKKLLNDRKDTITTDDISKNCPVRYGTFENIFKSNNTTVRSFLNMNGIKFQKAGVGYVYKFEDNEVTKSQFELVFTNKLRNLGYQYNKDYLRDVRYKTFINKYEGLLDCDYEIRIKDRIIYIEVAGMLRDYKEKYKTPQLIPSKSKSKYAEKLNLKEKMFIDNKLEYFILFPSDLKEENLDKLFDETLHIKLKEKELIA